MRKLSRPETLSQAAEWERTKGRYVALGLCEVCGAQAAWGHQKGAGGWSAVNPPCDRCALVVAALPVETTNAVWRKSLRYQ